MMLSCLRKAVCHVSGKSNFASLNRKSFPICSWYDRTFIKSVTIPRSQILVRLLMLLLMSCDVCLILCLPLVGLEGDLEHSVAKCVSVERLDGDQCLIVVGHCYKSKALALVCLQVSDHLEKVYFTIDGQLFYFLCWFSWVVFRMNSKIVKEQNSQLHFALHQVVTLLSILNSIYL